MAYSYKGAISFGLVYIPITLSVSIKENDIGFNMLDKNTMTRIKYKKTCVDCNNKEVKNDIHNITGKEFESLTLLELKNLKAKLKAEVEKIQKSFAGKYAIKSETEKY